MNAMVLISFAFFLVFFLGIGIAAASRSRKTTRDYYIASQSVAPWVVGLSAVATNNSGYMFIGVIGYTYTTGLPAIWLMLGWIAGDFIASLFIHPAISRVTAEKGHCNYGALLSQWLGEPYKKLSIIISIVSIVFLLSYASAQLVAGSKAMHTIIGWPTSAGAVVSALIIAMYCFFGGIRASLWTDVAQSTVMICAMAMLFFAAVENQGGFNEVVSKLSLVEGYLDWFPPASQLVMPGVTGIILFVLGWAVAGASVIGQPHIMVRFMTMAPDRKLWVARLWYYVWFTLFYLLATAVGLLSKLYFVGGGQFDAELALPLMANQLLPPFFVGLIIAGILSATMSTADSLILSCSSALTQSLFPRIFNSITMVKAGTLIMIGVALLIALVNSASVFNLVILSWSGLASAFAPLLIVLVFGKRPSEYVSCVMLFSGLAMAIVWRILGLHTKIYEGMPGIAMALTVYLIWHFMNKQKLKTVKTSSDG